MTLDVPAIEINVYATPKQLRRLADEMERKMPTVPVGQSTLIEIIYPSTHSKANYRIHVHADQSAWHRHQAGNKSDWSDQ